VTPVLLNFLRLRINWSYSDSVTNTSILILHWFLARDSMLSALYRKSVCLSDCPSHGWINRKRLKLGSYSFHRTVASSLLFLPDKFHPEIPTGSPRAAASNKGGSGKHAIFVVLTLSLGGCTS